MASLVPINFLSPITPSNFYAHEASAASTRIPTPLGSDSTDSTTIPELSADPVYIDENTVGYWIDPVIANLSGKKRQATPDLCKPQYRRPYFSVVNVKNVLATRAQDLALDVDAVTVKSSLNLSAAKDLRAFPASTLTRAWYMPSDWDLPQGDAYPDPEKPGTHVVGQDGAVQGSTPNETRSDARRSSKTDVRWHPYEPLAPTRRRTRFSLDEDVASTMTLNNPVQAEPTLSSFKLKDQLSWVEYKESEPLPGWKFAPPSKIQCPVQGCSFAFALSAHDNNVQAYKRAVYEHVAQHAFVQFALAKDGQMRCCVLDCSWSCNRKSSPMKHLCNHHLKMNIVRCVECEWPFSCDDAQNIRRHENGCRPADRESNLQHDPSSRASGTQRRR